MTGAIAEKGKRVWIRQTRKRKKTNFLYTHRQASDVDLVVTAPVIFLRTNQVHSAPIVARDPRNYSRHRQAETEKNDVSNFLFFFFFFRKLRAQREEISSWMDWRSESSNNFDGHVDTFGTIPSSGAPLRHPEMTRKPIWKVPTMIWKQRI